MLNYDHCYEKHQVNVARDRKDVNQCLMSDSNEQRTKNDYFTRTITASDCDYSSCKAKNVYTYMNTKFTVA